MEERGADQEVQIPGAEWLQRNVHQYVQGQQVNGGPVKVPCSGRAWEGGAGGGRGTLFSTPALARHCVCCEQRHVVVIAGNCIATWTQTKHFAIAMLGHFVAMAGCCIAVCSGIMCGCSCNVTTPSSLCFVASNLNCMYE